MICSVSRGDPKALRPRMCVTLFTSQPSESMLTLTIARTCSPGLPFEPTVFTISQDGLVALVRIEDLGVDRNRHPGSTVVVLGISQQLVLTREVFEEPRR